MTRSFLFASGFLGSSRTRDQAIKHAHGLSAEEIATLDEVLRALLARRAPESEELRAVLVQPGGVVLSLRGRRGRDAEARPTWVIFGRVEGSIDPRAPWSARSVVEDEASEALPAPPPPQASDPEYAAFFARERERGRAWRYDERAPQERSAKAPWLAGVLALALVLAMISPWPAPAPTRLDPRGAPGVLEEPLTTRLARAIASQRAALLSELRWLEERGIWRFGRLGEPEVPDAAAAGLQRAVRALRAAVEAGGELSAFAWEERFWPRDARGVRIEPALVLLGPRSLSDEELRALRGWLALLHELYVRGGAGG
ncbi:MAG: hypothetical protein IPN34_22255 [Planctomycetes bacterium]|nr:hypothetical protein [Planctomycetota bacterium]